VVHPWGDILNDDGIKFMDEKSRNDYKFDLYAKVYRKVMEEKSIEDF
jgi:hypothetical protein